MDHKAVFARYPLPAILVAPDRTLVAFNDLMLDYHTKSYGSDDVLRATVGQDWTGLSPTPALKAQGRAFHEEVFSTDGVAVTEWRMPGDAESPVFGRYWGRRVVEGDTVTGAVLVREDISRAIEHEHLARRSQILFQLLAERIEDIVLFMDVDGTVISCNPAGLAALGYELSELIGRHVSILSYDPEGLRKRWQSAVEEGGATGTIIQTRRADGTPLATQSRMTIFGEGDERFVCVWVRDMSQVQQKENRERLESLGVLASGIAHDVNNVLSGISGRLSLAELAASGGGDLPRMLAESQAAVERATRLTSQLLTFAKGGRPERAELDLAEFVPAEAEFSAAGSGLRLDCRVEDELWVVAADPGQVAQVIQNLVLNSIQATGGTGSIEISLRNVEEVDTPSAARTKCYVEMTFADDGPGIPPEIQGRIFDPYFSTKGSSGLGLATVYSIVERHGGSMTLESSEDRGTTFNIRWPALPAHDVPSKGESAVPEVPEISATPSLRALVMDDDDFLGLLMDDMFTVLGHDIDVVKDGDEALSLFQGSLNSGTPYGVVVLDVTIRGGRGGIETGRAMLELKPDVPIILMSGYHEADLNSTLQDNGFRAFLRKPFGLDALKSALQTGLT